MRLLAEKWRAKISNRYIQTQMKDKLSSDRIVRILIYSNGFPQERQSEAIMY